MLNIFRYSNPFRNFTIEEVSSIDEKVEKSPLTPLKIKNILIRRKESDIYLATVSRHRSSMQVAMKIDKMCSFQQALWPSSAEEDIILPIQVFILY